MRKCLRLISVSTPALLTSHRVAHTINQSVFILKVLNSIPRPPKELCTVAAGRLGASMKHELLKFKHMSNLRSRLSAHLQGHLLSSSCLIKSSRPAAKGCLDSLLPSYCSLTSLTPDIIKAFSSSLAGYFLFFGTISLQTPEMVEPLRESQWSGPSGTNNQTQLNSLSSPF